MEQSMPIHAEQGQLGILHAKYCNPRRGFLLWRAALALCTCKMELSSDLEMMCRELSIWFILLKAPLHGAEANNRGSK